MDNEKFERLRAELRDETKRGIAGPATLGLIEEVARRWERAENEVEAIRAEADQQTAKYRALAALVSRMIRYAREDEMRTPGSTRLARALAEAERVIAPDVGVPR